MTSHDVTRCGHLTGFLRSHLMMWNSSIHLMRFAKSPDDGANDVFLTRVYKVIR